MLVERKPRIVSVGFRGARRPPVGNVGKVPLAGYLAGRKGVADSKESAGAIPYLALKGKPR